MSQVHPRRVAVFVGAASLLLVPWTIGLARALPDRYVSTHWGAAWAGFDTALAASLALTAIAVFRRAAWADRVAVASATLLVSDAWFDVVTAHGALAVAVSTAEATGIELPVAFLCVWVAHRVRPQATVNPKGALQ